MLRAYLRDARIARRSRKYAPPPVRRSFNIRPQRLKVRGVDVVRLLLHRETAINASSFNRAAMFRGCGVASQPDFAGQSTTIRRTLGQHCVCCCCECGCSVRFWSARAETGKLWPCPQYTPPAPPLVCVEVNPGPKRKRDADLDSDEEQHSGASEVDSTKVKRGPGRPLHWRKPVGLERSRWSTREVKEVKYVHPGANSEKRNLKKKLKQRIDRAQNGQQAENDLKTPTKTRTRVGSKQSKTASGERPAGSGPPKAKKRCVVNLSLGKKPGDRHKARDEQREQKQAEQRETAFQYHSPLVEMVHQRFRGPDLRLVCLTSFYGKLQSRNIGRCAAAAEVGIEKGVACNTVLFWAGQLEAAVDIDGTASDVTRMDDDERLVVDALKAVPLLNEERRGQNASALSVLADPKKAERAKEWVREQLAIARTPPKKGEDQPQEFQVSAFQEWVSNNLDTDIAYSTACVWLDRLGFRVVARSTGIVVEVHERPDIVAYREKWAPIMVEEAANGAVFVVHDECIVRSKGWLNNVWHERGTPKPTLPKSKGRALMLSEFLTQRGLLAGSGRVLEVKRGQYFTGEDFREQVCVCIVFCH